MTNSKAFLSQISCDSRLIMNRCRKGKAAQRRGPSLIVMDDFLDKPCDARTMALQANYELFGGGLRYRNAKVPTSLTRELTEKVLRIIGPQYRRQREGVAFRQYLKRDERANRASGSWVHFDRFRWIGIVYLNPKHQCRGGTSFFTHRGTGTYRWPDLYKLELERPGTRKQVFQDMGCMDRWDESIRISMVFNRLVLFDSRLFHQAPCYFGTNLRNARLTLNVFFDTRDDGEMVTRDAPCNRAE